MTRLSVNINKVALLRNARGGNVPDLTKVARDCEDFGAEGITVHPRPDERHVRRADLAPLKAANRTEFNVEGYPSDDFVELVLATRPDLRRLIPTQSPGSFSALYLKLPEADLTLLLLANGENLTAPFVEGGYGEDVFASPFAEAFYTAFARP